MKTVPLDGGRPPGGSEAVVGRSHQSLAPVKRVAVDEEWSLCLTSLLDL